jgi:hypothetical protein
LSDGVCHVVGDVGRLGHSSDGCVEVISRRRACG